MLTNSGSTDGRSTAYNKDNFSVELYAVKEMSGN